MPNPNVPWTVEPIAEAIQTNTSAPGDIEGSNPDIRPTSCELH
jgi:hypothetical protein